jgi:hypothetical protein
MIYHQYFHKGVWLMRKKIKWIIGVLLIPALVLLFAAGCDTGGGGNGDSDGTGTHPLAGIWSGTWEDTVFSENGTLDVTITQSSPDLSASGTFGPGTLGGSDINGTGTGTLSGDTITFTFDAPGMGSGNGTVTGNAISGSGNLGPTSVFPFGDFTFDGTIDGNTINGTFEFTAGGMGTATVTKQ